jgi:hypothetical protein
MSIDAINAGMGAMSAARAPAPARAFNELTVGETLRLRVLERLGARDYVVTFGGERQRVESAVALEVGADVRVGVVAAGERLVLRLVDPPSSASTPEANDLLAQLARRYGVNLAANEREPLLAAAASAVDPTRMLLAGLYLAKLGVAPEQEVVAAVYEAQLDAATSGAAAMPEQLSAADRAELESQDVALAWLESAFENSGTQSDRGAGGDAGGSRGDNLARWALNLQDDGSVLYRYATLPLVIGGELRELQVALFAPRGPTARDRDVRRLVMTLETAQLEHVRIEARSVGERLAVAIDVATPAGVEALAERENEVRDLLARLGWSVEVVSYGVNVPPDRAARRIVDHVLTAGTVDTVF